MIIATHGIVASQIQSFVGLLDTYPNAAAAYSVRKLRTAYTGSAIRVRRSSDNTEQNIGFTALGNLDTSALTSFCSGTNGFVTTWYDQSGNGRDATQTTASNQPQIVSSGSVILENGNPSLQFDGDNDIITSLININTLNLCIISVNRANADNGNRRIYALGDITLNIGHIYASNDFAFSGKKQAGYRQPQNEPVNSVSSNLLQSLFFYNKQGTNNQELNINSGVTFNNLNTVTSFNSDVLNIGAQSSGVNQFVGFQQELILYPSNQSSNRTGIESNINTYYGIY